MAWYYRRFFLNLLSKGNVGCMIGMKNKRLKYLLLTLFVVMLGLLSRKMSACTLDFVKLYLGDILWAMMVYFGCRFLFVNMRKVCVLS